MGAGSRYEVTLNEPLTKNGQRSSPAGVVLVTLYYEPLARTPHVEAPTPMETAREAMNSLANLRLEVMVIARCGISPMG